MDTGRPLHSLLHPSPGCSLSYSVSVEWTKGGVYSLPDTIVTMHTTFVKQKLLLLCVKKVEEMVDFLQHFFSAQATISKSQKISEERARTASRFLQRGSRI